MNRQNLSVESVWNLLFLLSLVAIVVAGVAYFEWPQPQVVAAQASRPIDIDLARRETLAAQERNHAQLWTGDSKELGGSVLSRINEETEKQHVQVMDFRIEKQIELGGQVEAPFVVVLDGDFKDVVSVLGRLELPDSKLAVSLVQLASSDRSPGSVKATLGLTAFVRKVS